MKSAAKVITTDSMEQAAGVMGVTIQQLKFAKNAGCVGFRTGRVYVKEVKKWLEDNPKVFTPPTDLPDKDTLDRMLKKQRLDERERHREIEDRKYVLLGPIAKELGRIASAQRSVLQAKLENELPVKLAGLDVIAIREKMAECVNELCEIFAKGVEQWQ